MKAASSLVERLSVAYWFVPLTARALCTLHRAGFLQSCITHTRSGPDCVTQLNNNNDK